jgi:hypothetical protein
MQMQQWGMGKRSLRASKQLTSHGPRLGGAKKSFAFTHQPIAGGCQATERDYREGSRAQTFGSKRGRTSYPDVVRDSGCSTGQPPLLRLSDTAG